LSDPILESFEGIIVHSNEGMSRDFLGDFVLQLPHSFPLGELFLESSDLGQQSHLETRHREEQVRIVFRVDRNVGILPVNGGDTSRQSVLYLPEDTSSQVDVVFHESHSAVLWPTFPVVVAHNVLIVGVRVLGQISLN
jgi:hypothetical protein